MALRLVGCSGDWRPNSTIRRTPYSAFDEKITALNPTSPLGYIRARLAAHMDAWGLSTSEEVAEVAALGRDGGRLGIDTEFMSEGRYRALLCLIQVVVDDESAPG